MITYTIQEIQLIKDSNTFILLLKVIQGQRSSKVKDHEINWMTIYVTYGMCCM